MKKNKRNKPSIAESFYQYFGKILDICICVYMFMILVIMPFYNKEGFGHIGTDKADFFRKCITYGGRIVLPILAITVILGLTAYVQNRKNAKEKSSLFRDIAACCKKHISITDCFAFLYGVVVVISYRCTYFKTEGLWGTVGWYMGLIPQLASVMVYFLVSKAWKRRTWLVALILPVSAIVFVLGYLNRFGIYPIDMKIENPQFISTIGNINWYCGYLVSVFFGGMVVLWKTEWKNTWMKVLMMGYVAIGFATLVTQGSTSGILTMAVMFLVLFRMSASDSSRMEMFWQEMVIFSVTCLITYLLRITGVLKSTYSDTLIDLFTYSKLPIIMTSVSVAFLIWVYLDKKKGTYPEKAFKWISRLVCGGAVSLVVLFVILVVINTIGGGTISKDNAALGKILTFSPTWGSSRGVTWTAGWLCFKQQNDLHKLVGAGPDCMSAFLYNFCNEATVTMVRERFGTNRLTNAHNEWLTILVNMGVLGLISYVGMMLTAIKRLIQSHGTDVVATACGICVLAYTVNNMFSFQQSMNLSIIFIILGVGENYRRASLK